MRVKRMSETGKERKSQTSEGEKNDSECEPMGGKKNLQERNDDVHSAKRPLR